MGEKHQNRGKDQCKDLIMRVFLFEEQQEACIAEGEWVEWNLVWLKVRIVTVVQYPEGSGRPLWEKPVEGSKQETDMIRLIYSLLPFI